MPTATLHTVGSSSCRPAVVGRRRGRVSIAAIMFASCMVCAWPAAGRAAGPEDGQNGMEYGTRRLLDALEERQMPDVALWVLSRIEKDAGSSPDLKREVPFRRAEALVAMSRNESNAARRAELYEQASQELDAFLKQAPEGERAIQAYLQKGNLLVTRGRAKLEQAARPGEDAKKLKAEALPFFDAAIKTLDGPDRKPGEAIEGVANAEDAILKQLRQVDASLKELRGEGSAAADKDKDGGKAAKPKKPARKPGSAKQIADTETQQEELRGKLLTTRLLIADAIYDKARSLEPQSEPWKQAMDASTTRYKELFEKYRSRGAGLFARYFEGRNYYERGDRAKALATLADIRSLEGDADFVPKLRAKAINTTLQCWLDDKKYDPLEDRLLKAALAPLPAGAVDPDVMGMKYHTAKFLERQAAAMPDAEKSKRTPLQRDAKRLAVEVAKANKDYAAEARTLLADLGKELPDDPRDALPASFESAMDSARSSVAAMQARQAAVKQAEVAKNAAAAEAARKEVAAERKKAIPSLRAALALAGPDDLEPLNQARYLLSYLLYEEKQLHDAAALGEFLVDRYPNAKGSRQAATIAMASWQQLQKQPTAAWAQEAKSRSIRTAELILRTWPDSPEAADAALVAVAAATESRDPQRIASIVDALSGGSPRRAEVLLRAGGGLWREVQEKERLEEASRPAAAQLAAWRARAAKAIDDGLAAAAAAGGKVPAATQVAAALARSQIAMEDGDNTRVAALLEHATYGPWTVLNGKDKAFTHGPLAQATATASLRYFIETEQTDKAVLAMKKLEELAGAAGGDASARLTAMYQTMGRDLQTQLMALASGPAAGTPEAKTRAAGILTGFEKFLEGVARDPKPSSQIWVATTYLSLGSGPGLSSIVPRAKADAYLDRATKIYEALLAKGGPDVAKFEPAIRLKMASVYRELGRWDEAQKQIDWILADAKRQNTLDFQIQAAELLQETAAKAGDKQQKAVALAQAINGYKRQVDGREVWAWGWAVISNRLEPQAFGAADEKAMEARDKFFAARLNVLKCRVERAEALPEEREKELQKAFDYVDFTFKTHPDLGGPETSKQFDKQLKEIEKRQNKPEQRGIEGLRQAAAVAG